MDTKTNVVVGGSVSGNIGSCQVNSTDVQKDLLHVETMAVNSCTGQVVADYIHLDGILILIVLIILVLLGLATVSK